MAAMMMRVIVIVIVIVISMLPVCFLGNCM